MPTWTGSAVDAADAAAPEAVAPEAVETGGDELAAELPALLELLELLELLLEQPATTRPPAEHSAAAT
jgi:hypothetical protein